MERIKPWFNRTGFSFLEIMVTLMIVSIGIYAITTYFTQITKSHNTIIKKANEQNIIDDIYRGLVKPDVCRYMFGDGKFSVPVSAVTTLTATRLYVSNSYDDTRQTFYEVGTNLKVGPGLITLQSLRFDTTPAGRGVNITNNNPFGIVDLLIRFNRGGTFLGSQTSEVRIPISVELRNTLVMPIALRRIENCHAGVNPPEGQWGHRRTATAYGLEYQKRNPTASGGTKMATVLIGLTATVSETATTPDMALVVGGNPDNPNALRADSFLSSTATTSVNAGNVNAQAILKIPTIIGPTGLNCPSCSNGAIWIYQP